MDKKPKWSIIGGTILSLAFLWLSTGQAQAGSLTETLKDYLNKELPKVPKTGKLDSIDLMPVKTVDVKGDASKYRALNWQDTQTQFGINDLKMHAKYGKDVNVTFEGGAILGNEDYKGKLMLTRGEAGYLGIDYKTYRKYFETAGGYFPFTTANMRLNYLPFPNPTLDIGHFGLEIGRGSSADPSLSLGYEHDTKNGDKSTLNWGQVKDNAFGTATSQQRKIFPSFYRIDNTTDTVKLKGKTDYKGFTLKGEQKYSFFDGNTLNQEKSFSNADAITASANMIRQQIIKPQTKELSTTMRAERWMMDDKTFFSFGYRYGHMKNTVIETERDYTALANFTTAGYLSSGGRFRNGYADNDKDMHTWTGQAFTSPIKDLTLIFRFRGELEDIHQNSSYQTLNTSNVVTATTYQYNKNQITTAGESLSIRYKGIPKTSIYYEQELNQERNWKYKTVEPSTYSEQINRTPEGSGTLGIRYVPNNKVSLLSQYKHLEKNDKLKQVKGSSAAYINKLRTSSDSYSSGITLKPIKWMQNSFKYVATQNVFHIQVLSLDESKMPSYDRSLVYNMSIIPTDNWSFDASYARTLSKTGGINSASTYTPPYFTGNVDTYTASLSYAPKDNLTFYNSWEYSRAKNKTNADSNNLTPSSTGPMLFGQNESWYNIESGLKWNPKKNLKVEPHYAYQSFRSYPGIFTGNYSAHVAWLDMSVEW